MNNTRGLHTFTSLPSGTGAFPISPLSCSGSGVQGMHGSGGGGEGKSPVERAKLVLDEWRINSLEGTRLYKENGFFLLLLDDACIRLFEKASTRSSLTHKKSAFKREGLLKRGYNEVARDTFLKAEGLETIFRSITEGGFLTMRVRCLDNSVERALKRAQLVGMQGSYALFLRNDIEHVVQCLDGHINMADRWAPIDMPPKPVKATRDVARRIVDTSETLEGVSLQDIGNALGASHYLDSDLPSDPHPGKPGAFAFVQRLRAAPTARKIDDDILVYRSQ